MYEELKFILLYDITQNEYSTVDHNLPADEALRIVADLQSDDLPAFVADQRAFHLADEADDCPECQEAVQELFQRWAKTPQLRKKQS